jgi:hypothetical protein
MSTRILALPVAVLVLTMGCFAQLKTGDTSSSDDTASVEEDDERDEGDCDEDELEDLREECAEGDNDACLELARYIEWCEDDRDDDWDDDDWDDEDECDEECGELWREAYGDCIEAGGSEADCETRADRAFEDCVEECDDDEDWDDDDDECDEECGEETWIEAYDDCIEAGGSDADCETRADRALEDCIDECDDDDDDDERECRDGETASRGDCDYVCDDGEWTSDDPDCM